MSETVRMDGNPADKRDPSPREIVQQRLIAFLAPYSTRLTAPYGIVPGIEPLPKGGAARSVYFGVAGALDVRVTIFTPRDLVVVGAGALTTQIEGRYRDVAEVEAGITRLMAALTEPCAP